VEDASEVLTVRKDFRLQWEERAAGIHQVNARKMVFQCDLLRPQMLLHRDREVRAALDRGIIGDDNGAMAPDGSHAGDDACARSFILIHSVRGQSAELQKRRFRIEQCGDAFAHEHFSACGMAAQRFIAAALLSRTELLPKLGYQLQHGLTVGLGVCVCQRFLLHT
jgi:hypothetical protein